MKEVKTVFVISLGTFLGLFVGHSFETASSKVGETTTVLVVIAIFLIFFGFYFFNYFVNTTKEKEQLQELAMKHQQNIYDESIEFLKLNENSGVVIERLKHLITLLPLPWLFKDDDYADIERDCCGEIVVISPDLSNVTRKTRIKNVVKENLINGKKYTYIFPNKNEYMARFDNLKREFSKSNSHNFVLEKIPIPETQFNMIAVSHITILNFYEINDSVAEVYLQLPVKRSNDHNTCDYWIKCEEEAAKNFVSRVYQYLSNSKKNKIA